MTSPLGLDRRVDEATPALPEIRATSKGSFLLAARWIALSRDGSADSALENRSSSVARRRWMVIVLVVLVLAAVVQLWGMSSSPPRVDDEGTYVAQAWAVQTGRGLGHYTYWYDHPPLGWIQIAAWTKFTGAFERASNAVAAGREAMVLARLATCVLLYVLARRLGMRRAFALGAMMLLAFNPLALDFQRRVFLDNVATPWLLAAFALALSPRRRIGAVAGSALCFAAAVLSKETTLVLFPALLLQIWQHWDPRTRRFAIAIASVLGGLVISLYVVYAALKGELVPGPGHVSLWWSIDWQLFTRAGSGSMLDSSSGVRGLLETWLHLDAWLLGSAVLVAPCGLWFKRLRPVALAFVIIALMLVRGGYVPYPYVIAALPFAALVVAGVADEFWARSRFGPLPFASRRDGGARPSAFSNAAAWFRRRGRAVLVVTMALVLLLAAPAWAQGVRREMFEDRDVPMRNAQAWVEQHVSHQDVIVVDDSIWLDLIRAGYPEKRVLWFYKVDLDPAVKLPHGWRDISYLVLGPMGDDALVTMPKLSGALQHSRVVETYGQGPDAVSVYRVMRGA